MSFQSPVIAANTAVTDELDRDEEVASCLCLIMLWIFVMLLDN